MYHIKLEHIISIVYEKYTTDLQKKKNKNLKKFKIKQKTGDVTGVLGATLSRLLDRNLRLCMP